MGTPFKVKIWSNVVQLVSDAGQDHYIGGNVLQTVGAKKYTGSVPSTALRIGDHIEFRFGASELDTEGLFFLLANEGINWSNLDGGYKDPVLQNWESNKYQKSNFRGKPLDGPFSETARRLKTAGASAKYGVKSPLTVFSFTASDLATYCDRLALAIQRGVKN